ncbi:MAG TPA: DUF92 domain-containing protein [Gemmatimonadales bacterium]|nr:DUF92 domain-containing protein [Gemmatimonadales bacterium]
MSLPLAAAIAALVATLAALARALSGRGAVAAAAVGTAVLWTAGWAGAAALFAFFLSSSIVSRVLPDPAAAAGEAKGGRRDAGQVLANGGAAAIAALLAAGRPSPALWAITSSLAAAAADTWATAVGATSRGLPHDILSGAAVPPGTSGGVTTRGTLGALLGAFVVAAAAALVVHDARLLVAAVAIGAIGMLADSVAGATVQGRFHCPACDATTERAVHRCGTRTRLVAGHAWLTNDGVNALATGAAALLGIGAWCWIGMPAR